MKLEFNEIIQLFTSNDLVNYELGFQMMKGLDITAEEVAEICWDKWGVIKDPGSGGDIMFLFPYDLILSSPWSNEYIDERITNWNHVEVYTSSDINNHLFEVENINRYIQKEVKQAMIKASIFVINKCLEYD